MKSTHILGLMSGTSLDGLDLALCRFLEGESYSFELLAAETIAYPEDWENQLRNAHLLSIAELEKLNIKLGEYFADCSNTFLKKYQLHADAIASHGHTVFHQPEKKYTLQIGSGKEIARITGKTTVCDFRSLDVTLGGQGAPLVPVGDELLFSEYDYCLNIGGITNVSMQQNGKRIAFDIAPANMALNFLAGKKNKKYDHNGEIAASGKIIPDLLQKLNALDFYSKKGAKSLGREWFEHNFLPLINNKNDTIENLLATVCEHIAIQISLSVPNVKNKRMLVTGGGAHNTFLIERIGFYCKFDIVIPAAKIVDFKEALVFAFLGLLKLQGKINTYSSVTGASRDSTGGIVYEP